MINIVIVDDHDVVCLGLKTLLLTQPDFKVVGEAKDGLVTVALVEKLHPDILVLDMKIEGINGLEVTRQVRKKSPKTGIVILSMYNDDVYVIKALEFGAKAYISKENTESDLVRGIREVLAGNIFLSSALSMKAIAALITRRESKPDDPYAQVSSREMEVLQLAARGCSTPEIAARLFISPRTVDVHRANFMHKLGINSKKDFLLYAKLHDIVLGGVGNPE